jgi:uncharacterized protein (DUF4415 family)
MDDAKPTSIVLDDDLVRQPRAKGLGYQTMPGCCSISWCRC